MGNLGHLSVESFNLQGFWQFPGVCTEPFADSDLKELVQYQITTYSSVPKRT
jgi:hypothetical protein